MLKKTIRMIGILIIAVLLIFCGWIANGLFGNPVSALLASRGLHQYIERTYAHLCLDIDRFGYNFKTGGYFAYLVDDNSPDTAFYIDMDMLGHVQHDTYDTWVTEKRNTEQRVQEQYRTLVNSVLDSSDFSYQSDIKGGMLDFEQDREVGDPKDYGYAISKDVLVLDKVYYKDEILELGRQAGILTIYVMDDSVTAERAAQIMLHIKALFDEAEIPFYRMDFVLRYPRPEEESHWPEEDIRAEILYKDLYENGLEERILHSHESIYAWFDKQEK